MKRLKLSIIAIAIVLFPALSHAFQAGFARISMIDGDALIKTEDSTDWLPASPNTPLYEGDSIWSPDGSRVEIQLQNNTFVRLDERSSVSILALDKDFQQFNLGTGRLYVRTGSIQDNGLQIDVNDTSVMVYDRARFGVAITDGGDEEVSLIKGNAYVEGVGGRTRLRTGEMLTVEGSNSELAPLNPPDEWERWNRERDRRLNARPGGSGHIPEELAAYANDLDANGEWVRVPEYGYVWRPTVMATGEWSPYREGRWVWRGEEYVWVSAESWGWAPYHYGRWVVIPDRGWCWVPPARTDVYWGPGYVGWVTTPTYVGWVPLAPGEVYYGRGYYGRNSVNITNVNITRTNVTNVTNITNVTYRNVAVTNAVTVVRKDAFAAGRVEKVKVRENLFVQRNAVTLGAPAVRPVAREALMPVVKRVPPAKLPPARVANMPVRELRERHPQLAERPAIPPSGKNDGRGGLGQRKAPDDRDALGRQGPVVVRGGEQHPSSPVREQPRRQGDNPGSPAQREKPPVKADDRPGNRTAQTVRPVGQKPATPHPAADKAKKVWKVKQKENEKEDREKRQEHER